MRVIIAGARDITNPAVVIPIIDEVSGPWVIGTVLCGCARGVDSIGETWAVMRGRMVERFPADWATHGKAAGPLRNEQMAARADALLLIWHGDSPGSRNMLQRAAAHRLLIVERVIPRGPPR